MHSGRHLPCGEALPITRPYTSVTASLLPCHPQARVNTVARTCRRCLSPHAGTTWRGRGRHQVLESTLP